VRPDHVANVIVNVNHSVMWTAVKLAEARVYWSSATLLPRNFVGLIQPPCYSYYPSTRQHDFKSLRWQGSSGHLNASCVRARLSPRWGICGHLLERSRVMEDVLHFPSLTWLATRCLSVQARRGFSRSADRRAAGPKMAAVLERRSSARPTQKEHAVPFPVAAR